MSYFDGHIRDLGQVPQAAIAPLIEKLYTCQNLWATEGTKFSTVFPSTAHIVFKFPDNYPLSHVPASYRPAWIEWKHLLIPIISGVIEKLGLGKCETSKVMLARVNPGGSISEHIDENPSSAVPHKIHVPLLTHPRAIFHCEGVPYHLEVGRAYEVNNLVLHSVTNDSDTERVHFIFDCFPVGSVE